MGVIRLSFELVFVTVLLLIIIALIPTNVLFEDFPFEPNAYEVPDFQSAINKVGWDPVLGTKGKQLLKDKIMGPESIVVTDNFIYTGLSDGRIIEIDKESLNFRLVARISDNDQCSDLNFRQPAKCGRPAGMRLDPVTGNLIVVDPFFGVYKIVIHTGEKQLLAFGEYEKRPKEFQGYLNNFVLDPDEPNIIYVTVSTTRSFANVGWAFMEHENSGMVVAVDIKTQNMVKILTNLHIPNGIEVNPDKTHLLISESTEFRIIKVDLAQIRKQLKSGKVSVKPEVFVQSLPGEPDNIRQHNGDIYVGIAIARYDGLSLPDRLSKFPIVRKALARTMHLSSKAVKFLHDSIYEHPTLKEMQHTLVSGEILFSSMPETGAIVILDGKSGKVKRILGSNKFSHISEAVVDEKNGDIYFGSYVNKFLGKLSAKDL